MKFTGLIASILGIAAASMSRPIPASVNGKYSSQKKRYGKSRIAGDRGQAGDKLARMAAEGRLTLRKGW